MPVNYDENTVNNIALEKDIGKEKVSVPQIKGMSEKDQRFFLRNGIAKPEPLTTTTPKLFRSKKSGTWTDHNSWSVFKNNVWANPIQFEYPRDIDTVQIVPGHIVTGMENFAGNVEALKYAVSATTFNNNIPNILSGGFFDYNDSGTTITPITIVSGITKLTNDGLGVFTRKEFAPQGVTDVWDVSTNQFDFSELNIGDMVDIRVDLDVTTNSPNQTLVILLKLGIGGFQYYLHMGSNNQYKNAGTHVLHAYHGIYMGDANTRDNSAEIEIESDDSGSVVVNGWYIKILRRS